MEIPWPTQETIPAPGGRPAHADPLLRPPDRPPPRRRSRASSATAWRSTCCPTISRFVVYAASRGDFVLGGLQAVFETSLNRFLEDFLTGEWRCALDPGCRSGGGACMACLHLGEPSCRWFNRFLDRSSLFGEHGFLDPDA